MTPAERTTRKTARMMVLHRLRLDGKLDALSDADLGRVLGVDRTTIWKDKQALKRADRLYNEVMARQPWADNPGLTVQEAAHALGCDPGTLTGMIRGRLIHARKARGRWRIPATEVDRLKR